MSPNEQFDEEVRSLATLADSTRQRLYGFIVDQPGAVGRVEAAAGVGVPRHTAKFHLDKLVEEGLLEVEFRRLTTRSGPGAGRPAKLYRRAARTISVSLPQRQYELAGTLLAGAVAEAEVGPDSVADALHRLAADSGRQMGERFRQEWGRIRSRSGAKKAVTDALRDSGYEPSNIEDSIVMRNCPFHNLAQQHPELVCGMNLDLLVGFVEGMGTTWAKPRLDPAPNRCCVTIDLD
jgi:predicted ArsR family transcriptional regulator